MARGSGEGTIYKRKVDGVWCGQIDFGRDPNTGRRLRKSIYGSTKREVRAKMLDMMQKYHNRQINLENVNLIDWMYRWLNTYKKPKLRPRTYQSYESIIRVHIAEIGNYTVKKLKPITIQRFINSKSEGLSKRRIKYILTVLKAGLEQAVINNLITQNPAKHIEIPANTKPKKKSRAFTISEQAKFLDQAQNAYYGNLFIFALETGLRRGEILALKWSDVKLEEKAVLIRRGIVEVKQDGKYTLIEQPPKTEASKRELPLTTTAIKILKKQKIKQLELKVKLGSEFNDYDLVFSTSTGNYIYPRNILRAYYKILEQAGIEKCGMHTLRHTFATRLIEQNANPKVVQSLLGHSDISMTMNIYAHVLPDKKSETIALLEQIKY
ncbi:MAG: tyrosine-type recombinase/integrase [Clostridia bacterium]